MGDVFMYADETGNLDYDTSKAGASTYFGFGTAVFDRPHGQEMFHAMRLRAQTEHAGVKLPSAFHAKNDAARTRSDVFALIRSQAPRFDATLLYKPNAYPLVRAAGDMRLYKMAWYLHFKKVARQVARADDTLYVIAGSFGTRRRATTARLALQDVCDQTDRTIRLCVWDAPTSWGLQVADYGLWAAQRILEGRPCPWFHSSVQPTLESFYTPWGRT